MKKSLNSLAFILLFFGVFFCTQDITSYAKIYNNYNLRQGKSFFVVSDFEKAGALSWQSSNSNIVEVERGVVYGKNQGSAQVSTILNGVVKEHFTVNVLAPEYVKFVYANPNSASYGSRVALVAITNKDVQNVRFIVCNQSGRITIDAAEKAEDGPLNYIYKGYTVASQIGKIPFKIQAFYNGIWNDCAANSEIFVNTAKHHGEMLNTERRISNECIKLISEFEGFVPKIKKDCLAKDTYDIGYGVVISNGHAFYNNITRNEGLAMLINQLNAGKYTRDVNQMLLSNNVKFNQFQFDALVSFSYNLGTAWTKDSALKNLILSCEVQPGVRDLNFVNRDMVVRQMLKYHHVANKCISGLLYRRISEAQLLFFGEYLKDGKINKHNFPLPDCHSK